MGGVPITLIDAGGFPITQADNAVPMTPVDDGGIACTLVDDGGYPVTLINDDFTPWAGGFSPASLFANGEVGAWFDPSDFSTLFQDSNGTTPVTAVGQPVGMILDKSRGVSRGPEIVVNGSFATQTDWTLGTGWTWVNGKPQYSGALAANRLDQLTPTGRSNGKWYECVVVATILATPNINATVSVNFGGTGQNMIANGPVGLTSGQVVTVRGILLQSTLSPGAGAIRINSNLNYQMNFRVESVSFREVPGNHAYQTTTTARPSYQAGDILRPDASDDNLLSTLILAPSGNTIAWHGKVPASLAATQVLLGASGSSTARFFVGFNTSGHLVGGVGSDSTDAVLHASDYRGQTGTVVLREDGSNWALYWNGAQVATGVLNGAPTTTIPLRVFALNNDGTAASFSGADTSGVLAIQRALTPSEIANLSNYWSA